MRVNDNRYRPRVEQVDQIPEKQRYNQDQDRHRHESTPQHTDRFHTPKAPLEKRSGENLDTTA